MSRDSLETGLGQVTNSDYVFFSNLCVLFFMNKREDMFDNKNSLKENYTFMQHSISLLFFLHKTEKRKLERNWKVSISKVHKCL